MISEGQLIKDQLLQVDLSALRLVYRINQPSQQLNSLQTPNDAQSASRGCQPPSLEEMMQQFEVLPGSSC